MLLKNKNAVVYGAGGVGGAVARAFAREGAKVFLAGRTLAKVEAVVKEIAATGGAAEATQVDALDEQAVGTTASLREQMGPRRTNAAGAARHPRMDQLGAAREGGLGQADRGLEVRVIGAGGEQQTEFLPGEIHRGRAGRTRSARSCWPC